MILANLFNLKFVNQSRTQNAFAKVISKLELKHEILFINKNIFISVSLDSYSLK